MVIVTIKSTRETSTDYYFRERNSKVISEERQGTYRKSTNHFPVMRFIIGYPGKFLINHGKHPINEAYACDITRSERKGLKEYAEKEPVTILQNNSKNSSGKSKRIGYLVSISWIILVEN